MTLAFADDLVLLSNNWEGMKKNTDTFEVFCAHTGLMVRAKKCHGFLISLTKDSYVINNYEDWSINNNKLHTKYLDLKINPWTTTKKPDAVNLLQDWIHKIYKAPLKPSQKQILNVYTIPRLIYQMDHAYTNQLSLKNLHGLIRKAIKRWLHLPESTCNGLLYSSNRDGGLGSTNLSNLIPSIQIRRLQRMAMSSNPIISTLMRSEEAQVKLQNLWIQAGGDENKILQLKDPTTLTVQSEDILLPVEWEPSPNQKPKFMTPCNWRNDEFENWTKLPVQGTRIKNFKDDPDSNSWLAHHKGFKERHYIAALQLRTNVYPNRESLNRGQRDTQHCYKCQQKTETYSHILDQCPCGKSTRIKRHNKICYILAKEAKKQNWEIRKEPHFRLKEVRKPDLIFTKNNESIVIDVTVRYEQNLHTLKEAEREKVVYYEPLKEQIKETTGAEKVTFYGFPIGARGKWHNRNFNVLQSLQIRESRQKQLFSRRALLYSLDILSMF
uniref:Reverse transcriptase domain-containing protein n=1 Tax=Lepisosteus oculatus TaxID=7918 RepID=W5M4D3_LEPOC